VIEQRGDVLGAQRPAAPQAEVVLARRVAALAVAGRQDQQRALVAFERALERLDHVIARGGRVDVQRRRLVAHALGIGRTEQPGQRRLDVRLVGQGIGPLDRERGAGAAGEQREAAAREHARRELEILGQRDLVRQRIGAASEREPGKIARYARQSLLDAGARELGGRELAERGVLDRLDRDLRARRGTRTRRRALAG
jgi:hypothetical protein